MSLSDKRKARLERYLAQRETWQPKPGSWGMLRYDRWLELGGIQKGRLTRCRFYEVAFMFSYLRGIQHRTANFRPANDILMLALVSVVYPLIFSSGAGGWQFLALFLIGSYISFSGFVLLDMMILKKTPGFRWDNRLFKSKEDQTFSQPVLVIFWLGIMIWKLTARLWKRMLYPLVARVESYFTGKDPESTFSDEKRVGVSAVIAVLLAVAIAVVSTAGYLVYLLFVEPLQTLVFMLVILAAVIMGAAILWGTFLLLKRVGDMTSRSTADEPGVTKAKVSPKAVEALLTLWDWSRLRKWKICPFVELPDRDVNTC